MPKKLSQFKVGKILKLYLQGYSQTAIAHKLTVDQSTVSFQVGKFKVRADEVGIETAGKEYGVIMDEIEMLHSLAVDLHAAGLSAEEAAAGLGVVSAFEELSIEQDYQNVIKAAAMMQKEGFLDSAIELGGLEQSTGMDYKELVDKAVKTSQHLEKALIQLEETNGKLDDIKNDLENMESKKELATDDLAAHMAQVGLDKDRLMKVEALALSLKKAGVDNQHLEGYLQRQQQLNEAGIGIDVFTGILEKAGVVTHKDHGKALLQMLTEYGGLSEANQSLKLKINSLEKEVAGLEEKAKLKGKIGAEIVELKAEKASLEPHVVKLHDQKDLMDKVRSEVSSLTEKKAGLVQEIAGLEASKASMSDKIKSLEETTNDLEERKAEYDAVSASLSEVEERLAREKKRLQIFDSFLGFVRSSSVDKLETFADDAAYFVEDVKKGNHSPQLIRNTLIQNLTEGTLQVLRCSSCEVKFVVDKQPLTSGADYYCPLCGMTYPVKVDKDALAILHEGLVELSQFQTIIIQPKLISPQEHRNKLDNGGK